MGWKPTGAGTDDDAIHDDVAGEIAAITEKATPVDADLVVIEDSAAANVKKRVQVGNLPGGGGGGGVVPEWISYLAERQGDETPHADDDFFDTDTSGDYTEQTVSGTATWTIGRGVLSVKFDDQSGGDAAAKLKSLTPVATPVTIETAISAVLPGQSFDAVALCFTDGTATGSNHAAVAIYNSGTTLFAQLRAGTLTSMAATVSTEVTNLTRTGPLGLMYVRLVWSAANTFKGAWSSDGVTWSDFGTTSFSKTMTPTHFGVFVSTSGGNEEGLATAQYLRVDEADLSA